MANDNSCKGIIKNALLYKNPILEVKTNIGKGSLIAFNINDTLVSELNLIINYMQI